jgi:hypothetical protein
MEDIANKLWKKVSHKGLVSVWRKPTNHLHCAQEAKLWRSPPLCTEDNSGKEAQLMASTHLAAHFGSDA